MEDLGILFDLGPEPNLQLASPEMVTFYEGLKNRTFWLQGEISENNLELVNYLIRWNREDKGIPIENRKPIRLIIDSPGGALSVSETLSNLISSSYTPVYGIALGNVASGASMIYLSCHKRYALPNTVFVLHKGSCSGLSGNFNELQAFMNDYEKQISDLSNFYIEHTSYTEEEVKQNIQTDWYIRIDEALEKGLVNEKITNFDILI